MLAVAAACGLAGAASGADPAVEQALRAGKSVLVLQIGSDWCDWSKFLETLMAKGYANPFVIENEGCNSSHTGNMGATMQGFRATILNTAPVVWPLGSDGYAYDRSARRPMRWVARAKELPVVTMKDLG